jgi:uncharacterized protein (TIGR03435 family)
MTHRIARNMTCGRSLLLAAAVTAAVTLPVAIGILNPPRSQAQSAVRPEFEVASLKSNASGMTGFSIRALPGGLTARNISLKRLVAMGYSVTDYQIFGAVTWLESARFDLEAKSPGPAQLPELRLMVQSMLDDRFKLKTHRETRELPIYSLVLARSGVKGGPGLVESAVAGCGPTDTPAAPAPKGPRLPAAICGTVNPGPGRIFGQHGRISQLADRLATLLGRTVVDKTGLDGTYDIELTFTPDADMAQQAPPGQAAADVPGPSLFTAIQEQLGLRLQAGKGPVEVIVIDAAGKPTEN